MSTVREAVTSDTVAKAMLTLMVAFKEKDLNLTAINVSSAHGLPILTLVGEFAGIKVYEEE